MDKYRAPTPTSGEPREDRPKFLHMSTVFPSLRCPRSIDEHPQGLHYRLQPAFRAESVQLIGIRPTIMTEEYLRIFPVPSMRIEEICGVHRHSVRPP